MRIVQIKTSSKRELKSFTLEDHTDLTDLANEAADSFGLHPGKYSLMGTKGIYGTVNTGNNIFPNGAKGKDVPNAMENILVLLSME